MVAQSSLGLAAVRSLFENSNFSDQNLQISRFFHLDRFVHLFPGEINLDRSNLLFQGFKSPPTTEMALVILKPFQIYPPNLLFGRETLNGPFPLLHEDRETSNIPPIAVTPSVNNLTVYQGLKPCRLWIHKDPRLDYAPGKTYSTPDRVSNLI